MSWKEDLPPTFPSVLANLAFWIAVGEKQGKHLTDSVVYSSSANMKLNCKARTEQANAILHHMSFPARIIFKY